MAGRIDLDKRRLHRRESDEHVVGCPTCSTVKLPSATTARAACEIAGVDPSTFAFRDGRLIDEEREHYSTVAAQAATLVLAARLRGRASNTDMVDVLGRAFSRTYRHAIAETPARSIREMTVPRAKTIRTELEHAGIDLAGLRKATDVTRVYTIERIDTVTPHGGRAGRRVVEQIAEYARKLEERLDAASWLPTLGDASSADEQDDDDQAEV